MEFSVAWVVGECEYFVYLVRIFGLMFCFCFLTFAFSFFFFSSFFLFDYLHILSFFLVVVYFA